MTYYYLKLRSLFFIMGFFCFHLLPAQDQRKADSLAIIYNDNQLQGIDKLILLKELAYNEMDDLEKALTYADELIELSDSIQNNEYLFSGHLQKGYKYMELGKYRHALDEFIKCSRIAKTLEDLTKQGTAYSRMGEIAGKLGNFSTAEYYYEIAISILRELDDTINLAIERTNLGDIYLKDKEYDKAEEMFTKAWPTFKNRNNQILTAYYLGNMGMVYSGQGEDSLAERNLKEAISILEGLKDYSAVSVYLLTLSDIYARQDNLNAAFNSANRSLELAKQNGLQEKISDANLKLSELYESIGNDELALEYSKKYRVYKDSLYSLEANNTTDLLRTYEVQQEQKETALQIQKRKNQRIILYATASTLIFIIWLAIVLYRRNKYVRATNKIISTEKERSDNLLLNILPKDTAQELKDKGRVQAKRFESVTILFTDFAGFTRYAEHLPPEDVVTAIDFYFSKFDDIIEKYGLEKIKTVGDAYMCAGGLPVPTKDHAYKVLLAAIEIMNFVNEVKAESKDPLTQFDIRIGINTGPVVAGVVGSKKFAYDIWGDSVNIASRMESNSKPGRINISENTYLLVKDKINCKFRGNIEVKNRGDLKMYFVDCLKD